MVDFVLADGTVYATSLAASFLLGYYVSVFIDWFNTID